MGVAFTGSTETAWTMQKNLAERRHAIIPFIAETGGQNAMIVDSTALTEQVVDDIIRSAFLSAGQRCSALRVVFLQEESASNILAMLAGAMRELRLGNPALLSTDIGPVIDSKAQESLQSHANTLSDQKLFQGVPSSEYQDSFVIPQVFRITAINDLKEEQFGPLLHVVTYKAKELDQVIDSINQTGFGLTLGIHSRVESRIAYISKRTRVGNIYVNRAMTGAVVGVQPFGGMGLSGTGPKAGGPHYLTRFITEKTVSINTTAAGGNTTLTTLNDH
jgi:RHH-type proline utilization regulon transcriptional repressor/proline dehydrogenase/delta 1-pyrroline-5-carboxylate dehydrogenase